PATACNPHIAPAKAQKPEHNPKPAPRSCAKDPDPADQATSRPRQCDAAPATARARATQAQTNAPATATRAIDQNPLAPRSPAPRQAPLLSKRAAKAEHDTHALRQPPGAVPRHAPERSCASSRAAQQHPQAQLPAPKHPAHHAAHPPPRPTPQRHRVGRTTPLQPPQKPQPTLRKRQRNFRRTSNRAQRRTTRPRFPQTLHKPTNRPRFKQAADRNLNIKARSDPADQTRRKQRVSTQLKKVVLNPNPLDPQNLRKQPAQQLLTRRARKPPNAGAKLRRRQRSSFQLPVRRQRKTIQNNNRRRHHVIGKPRTNMRAQLASFRRTTRSQNNVANKLAAARIAA